MLIVFIENFSGYFLGQRRVGWEFHSNCQKIKTIDTNGQKTLFGETMIF